MTQFSKVLLALATLTLGTQVHAAYSDDVMGMLYTMKSVYSAEYAPAGWKKQFANYDLNIEFNKATAAVQANPNLTVKDARKIFIDFIYAMKDYHTSISFVSTESASLPFVVHGTPAHEYLVYIDRTKLPLSSFPFQVGDELVSIDGKSAVDVVAEVQNTFISNVDETDRGEAELRLTARSASRGLEVPKGPVTLGIKRQGETTVSSFQMIWEYRPEIITPRSHMTFGEGLFQSVPRSAFRPVMDVNADQKLLGLATPFDLGTRQTFTPDLGVKVWESDATNTFYAYIYKTADRKLIGYLRLPQYEADDYVKAVADFAKIIQQFQTVTDSMVIDQVNNPGGSVLYLYALASMLTDQPLKTPLHRMAITQADVAQAVAVLTSLKDVKTDADAVKAIDPKEIDGFTATYEFAKFRQSYAQFIISEWSAGRKLTNPYWIDGVDHINPAAVHYTKPILLVTNHLDFSGGDFFPTIMQDNKRVTVFGSRTAGAGGYVNDVNVPNNVGINAFRVTESIAERVSGNPIENLGVTPDIVYEMTDADYTSNFTPYVKALNTAVLSITP